MPSTSKIRYDHSFMHAARSGAGGFPDGDRATLAAGLERVRGALLEQKRSGKVGFFGIPGAGDLRLSRSLARDVAGKFSDLVVIGIGGSDLGARAIIRALRPEKKGMRTHFIGANTDPEEIASLLARVDLRKCALNVISKSGDTIEPMSAFVLLRDRLVKRVGAARAASHVIATTDRKKGTLRQIADREGYRTLPVPEGIGGRFSALTTVGLFPAACAGVPVKGLIDGAAGTLAAFERGGIEENGPLMFAGLHHDAYVRRGQHISVLMPYADALKDLGAWFRQLWAESLGKRKDRRGNVVHHGLTPVAALGATDQHSQIQLYNEGPADKIVTFIEVEKFRSDFRVPNPYPDIEGTAYMAGHPFSGIIHAERRATAMALAKNGRPSGTLFIPKIGPESVGGLMFFFMLATAAMGELLDIDAYDQPGVEEGKKTMYAILGRRGYGPIVDNA